MTPSDTLTPDPLAGRLAVTLTPGAARCPT